MSIAAQTHVPLAILYGRDRGLLCAAKDNFAISDMPVREALAQAAALAHYRVEEQGGVFEIVAPDLTAWQLGLLEHRFQVYHFRPDAVLNELFTLLQGSLLMDAEGARGYASSTLSAPSALRFTLPDLYDTTAEQVANHLVSLDGHAVWIFRAAPDPTEIRGDQFDIYSYRDDLSLIPAVTCK